MLDINRAVKDYCPLVDELARRIAAGRRAKSVGAEYDDLRQEGLIFIWLSLERGVCPSRELVQKRMQNWVRTLYRQQRGIVVSSPDLSEVEG